MRRSRILAALLCGGALLAGTLATPSATARGTLPAPIGQDPILAGAAYTGDFPDPWILHVRGRYYAYATTSDNLQVPVLTSSNLRGWVAAPPTSASSRGDGLPATPAWSGSKGPWAPSVTKLGPHRFVLAYATEYGEGTDRMCISLATSTSPLGPFVDRSTAPTICPARGAIDPQVFVAPGGRPWLLWKIDHFPARLYTQPMNRKGTRLKPGVAPRFLAKVKQSWEGRIIENPAMIRFKKRYYLFYSANSYASTRYAIGYLVCKSWKGDCRRPRKKPLLATGGLVAGPGGPAPLVDKHGRLRLGYHAWRAGAVGYPANSDCRLTAVGCGQRRLYVATLKVKPDGRLRVVRRY